MLALAYLADLVTSFILDPSLRVLEQNPLVVAGGWPYAIGVSVVFVLGLSWLWDWSWKNDGKLAGPPMAGGRKRLAGRPDFKKRFFWLMAGPKASERWPVIVARALMPANVAMKILLSANNLLFFFLLRVASTGDNEAMKAALGLEGWSVWQFQRTIFFVMMGLTALAGLAAFGWVLGQMVGAKRATSGRRRA